MKNILMIGSGAREQAIVVALGRRNDAHLFCFGTNHNPGILPYTQAYRVGNTNDSTAILSFATEHQIHLCIIGPEAPLAVGLADVLQQHGIAVIGPTQALARIETDKAYARDLMTRFNIAGTPRYQVFTALTGVKEFLHELGEGAYVVKATGLMGGKGVKVAGEHLASIDEALEYASDILKQEQAVVIEEKLMGQEFSAMCFTDGKTIVPMPLVQDHKRAYEDDTGPNTGGMGSYSDADHSLPFLKPSDIDAAFDINKQVVAALYEDTGMRYHGVLYGSFIATATGISVIEFNARFGDPEAMNVLSLLETDLLAICEAIATETLDQVPVQFKKAATVCKYAVPLGYPDKPQKNILLADELLNLQQGYFYGAVDMQQNKAIATGSRTLAYVGMADTIANAEEQAESMMKKITGDFFHRADIGTEKALKKRFLMMQQLRAV